MKVQGCFDAAVQPQRIFLTLEKEGESRSYEAFPILEEQAQKLTGGMESPRGFSLTLPEGLSGEYALTLHVDGISYALAPLTVAEE